MKSYMDDYYVFCQVARFGSMKVASERTELPLSTISRRIVSLEERLGLQLFIRSKNKLVLSNQGQKFYDTLKDPMIQMVQSIDDLNSNSGELTGRVVLSVTKVFYLRYLHENLAELLRANPKLQLILKNAHAAISLDEDIDVAVVTGVLPESNLIGRKLSEVELNFVASQKYFIKYQHEIEQSQFNQVPYISTFTHPSLVVRNTRTDEVFSFKPKARMVVMDIEMVLKAVTDSLGYAVLPDYYVEYHSAADELVQIFDGYQLEPVPFSLLYRNRNLQSAAQRAVIDCIIQSFE